MTSIRETLTGQETKLEKSSWHTIIASQALTATVTSAVQEWPHGSGVLITVITSSGASTPIITPSITTVDDDGNSLTLWTAAATITTDTTTSYLLAPGGATGFSVTEDIDGYLPREWKLVLTWSQGSFTVEAHATYV